MQGGRHAATIINTMSVAAVGRVTCIAEATRELSHLHGIAVR